MTETERVKRAREIPGGPAPDPSIAPRIRRNSSSVSQSPCGIPLWIRILATLSSPIPGVGHVLLGRYLKGSLYFCLFLVALDGAFLNLVLDDDQGRFRTFLIQLVVLAALIWLIALIDLFVTLVLSRALDPEERNSRFIAGVSHDLRGEAREARALFTRLLARNPADAPAAIQLASVLRRQGKLSKALRLLKRTHKLDRQRVWEYEILSSIRRIREAKQGIRVAGGLRGREASGDASS